MFLTNRNTYKTKKIMLLYACIALLSFTLGVFSLLLIFTFKKWWLYLTTIIFFIAYFFSYFLLVIENNNYKIKYYFNKNKFKKLYLKLLDKHNIEDEKCKRQIKKIAKDYYYQYGEIDENNSLLKSSILNDWVIKKSVINIQSISQKEKLEYFLFELYVLCNKRSNIEYSPNIKENYEKEELVNLLNESEFINDSFKDKCLTIYDKSYIDEEFLDNLYLELIYVIEAVIGLISKEELDKVMYNTLYYYTNDKRVCFYIEKEYDLYSVVRKNIDLNDVYVYKTKYKSKEEALELVKEELEEYNCL